MQTYEVTIWIRGLPKDFDRREAIWQALILTGMIPEDDLPDVTVRCENIKVEAEIALGAEHADVCEYEADLVRAIWGACDRECEVNIRVLKSGEYITRYPNVYFRRKPHT